jgi:H/ACA ribonucleoprotein complex subunit 3
MMKSCPDCGRYTLQGACPRCGADTQDPQPAKFSPEDKYGSYRRKLKRMEEADDTDEDPP